LKGKRKQGGEKRTWQGERKKGDALTVGKRNGGPAQGKEWEGWRFFVNYRYEMILSKSLDVLEEGTIPWERQVGEGGRPLAEKGKRLEGPVTDLREEKR